MLSKSAWFTIHNDQHAFPWGKTKQGCKPTLLWRSVVFNKHLRGLRSRKTQKQCFTKLQELQTSVKVLENVNAKCDLCCPCFQDETLKYTVHQRLHVSETELQWHSLDHSGRSSGVSWWAKIRPLPRVQRNKIAQPSCVQQHSTSSVAFFS